mmetsp:Transcript_55236/g.135248  ORF Transcript_55236/g.135248 Transcript_55236/m.135248 type:complete len:225 (-) Transcript_55236:3836-4510(-)
MRFFWFLNEPFLMSLILLLDRYRNLRSCMPFNISSFSSPSWFPDRSSFLTLPKSWNVPGSMPINLFPAMVSESISVNPSNTLGSNDLISLLERHREASSPRHSLGSQSGSLVSFPSLVTTNTQLPHEPASCPVMRLMEESHLNFPLSALTSTWGIAPPGRGGCSSHCSGVSRRSTVSNPRHWEKAPGMKVFMGLALKKIAFRLTRYLNAAEGCTVNLLLARFKN